MAEDALNQIVNLRADEVQPIASQLLGTDAAPIGALTVEKIGRSVGQATVGIYHVTGQANTSSGEKTWSAVVKVLGVPAFVVPDAEVDPYRELAAYQSGKLDNIQAGLRPAHCYTIGEQDGRHFLWLEDMSAAPQPPWKAEYFIRAARHLGLFNGHWPERALPGWEWLHIGGIRSKYRAQGYYKVFEKLDALQAHDIVGQALPPDVTRGLAKLWHQGEGLVAKVEAGPKGICHGDCHPKNLFPVFDLTGEDLTVAIDWTSVGIGSLGHDVGQMLASSIKWMEVPLDEAERLVEPIFDAYLSGLAEAGWSGNEDRVRLAYLTCLGMGEAVRIAGILDRLSSSPNPLGIATFFRAPAEGFFERWGDILRFFLVHNDQALQLSQRLECDCSRLLGRALTRRACPHASPAHLTAE